MLQDERDMQATKPVADDSEPYRRLIELQKQMIGLVQQHEKTKRECAALRAQLLEEMAGPRRSWHREIGRAAAGLLKHVVTFGKTRAERRSQRTNPSRRALSLRNPTSAQPGYDQSY
jgi:hypothetical protein